MEQISLDKMTASERRVAITLAGIFSLRMLGLFMILPVFAVYAEALPGYTATLAGIAVGIYGLTQAIFQIPMGRLSDKIGRKPVIVLGLFIFALGSVIAAISDSLPGIILGRALQGSGAIAGAVMALAADLTREEHRLKVMATIGMSIGMSFALALILGPLLHGAFGVTGIFWATSILALGGVLVVIFRVPQPVVSRFHRDTEVELHWFKHVLSDSQLLRLDTGVLILHFVLTAMFMVVPHILKQRYGMDVHTHWQVYLPVLLLSVAAIIPFIITAERRRRMKQVLLGAISALILACLGMALMTEINIWLMGLLLFLFFAGFNLLEALLPSLVAKTTPAMHKGTAMGAYSSAQFMGAFLGGSLGGWMLQHYSIGAVFLMNGGLLAVWWMLAITMRPPHYLSSLLIRVGEVDEKQAREISIQLTRVQGVAEAVIIPSDGVAYLKVDNNALDREALAVFSAS